MKTKVCTLLFLLCLGMKGFAVEGWKEFSAKESECRISFPVQPQHVKERMYLPAVNAWMEYDIYVSILQPKAIFLMLVAKYPQKMQAGQVRESLEGFLKGMTARNPDNHLIFADLNEIKGEMALEFFLRSTNTFFRGKLFMQEGKLYLLAVESKEEAEIEALFHPFVESFRWDKR